jgi:hypothetical protein
MRYSPSPRAEPLSQSHVWERLTLSETAGEHCTSPIPAACRKGEKGGWVKTRDAGGIRAKQLEINILQTQSQDLWTISTDRTRRSGRVKQLDTSCSNLSLMHPTHNDRVSKCRNCLTRARPCEGQEGTKSDKMLVEEKEEKSSVDRQPSERGDPD